MSRVDELKHNCEQAGFYVATYSPGDGVTRYRFFTEPGNSYFGPGSGVYTALGFKEADAYATGRIHGTAAGLRTAAAKIRENCSSNSGGDCSGG